MKFEYCRGCRDEVTSWSILVNIALMTYKGLLGIMTGSAALVADAMHSGADVVASGVTMMSLKLSNRPKDEQHPYGYGNIQFISSAIVGIILILGAIYLIYESTISIIAGDVTTPSVFAVLGAGLSALTNEMMYRYQSCVGQENNSPAILANAWDNRSDAVSSLAVLIGILIAIMGFPIADNLAAIAVGFLVIRIGIELNTDAIKGLMDSSIETDDLKVIYNLALNIDGVEGISYLRGRNVGEDMHIEIDIKIDRNLSVKKGDQVSDWIEEKIIYELPHVRDVRVMLTPVEVVGKKKAKGPNIPVVIKPS